MKTGEKDTTLGQIRRHYEIEKRLASKLRLASAAERKKLYGQVYAELRQELSKDSAEPDEKAKRSPLQEARRSAAEMRFLRRFLTPDIVFLELGASACTTSIQAASFVRKAFAVDVSFGIVDSKALPSNLECKVFDGCHIPVLPSSVDLVYSHQVMEHVHPDDALEQLRSICEVLSCGGKYVCITPNRLSGPHDISKYFDQEPTGFHLKEYTSTELAQIFRSVGFTRVRHYVGARGCYIPVPEILLTLLEKSLGLLPWSIRAALGRGLPLRPLLAIRIVGFKADFAPSRHFQDPYSVNEKHSEGLSS